MEQQFQARDLGVNLWISKNEDKVTKTEIQRMPAVKQNERTGITAGIFPCDPIRIS